MGLDELLGCDPDRFCDTFYARRPDWVRGSISHFDARYLFRRVLAAQPSTIVEVGTASGFSTAVLGLAMSVVARSRDREDLTIFSYDISRRFYADPSRMVGDAAREVLDPDVLARLCLRNPASALDVAREHEPGSLRFLFIDAHHGHPWPALDLLATLDTLGPGAEVVLHDVGLAQRSGGARGPEILFASLDLEKLADPGDSIPNIGSLFMPDDPSQIRPALLEIVEAHPWEATVADDVTRALLAGG